MAENFSNFDDSLINPLVVKAQYAVRGAIAQKSNEIEKELADNKSNSKYNFDHILSANTGNPLKFNKNGIQITYPREVLSLLINHNSLLSNIIIRNNKRLLKPLQKLFSKEAIQDAIKFLKANPSGLGVYTHSQGFPYARKIIADFIAKRDGYPADPEKIFMSDGASSAIKMILSLLSKHHDPATNSLKPNKICVPVPMYPLYSASITLNGSEQLNYYLDEEKDWDPKVDEIEQLFKDNNNVSAIVIINPGNPSGNILSYEAQKRIIDLCSTYGVTILADEVYQSNIYIDDRKFISFKKALYDWAAENENRPLPALFSFHSASKGVYGECGLRGGYAEYSGGYDEELFKQLYKMASISLCPNTVGQIMMMSVCEGSTPGTEAYNLQKSEKEIVLKNLKKKAAIATKILNQPDKHMTCRRIAGALYAYPKLEFPQKFIDEAKKNKTAPDSYWCMKLLEEKGYALVSGSGFTNFPNTYHARLTILNDLSEFEDFINGIVEFHEKVWSDYV